MRRSHIYGSLFKPQNLKDNCDFLSYNFYNSYSDYFSQNCVYVTILSLYLAIQFFLAILSLYLTIQIFFPQNWWFISCICKFILQFWVYISQFCFFCFFCNSDFFIAILSLYLAILNYCLSDLSLYLNSDFFFVRIVSLSQLYFTFFLSILSRVAKSWKNFQ